MDSLCYVFFNEMAEAEHTVTLCIDLLFSKFITDTVNSIRLDSVGVPKYAIQGKKAVLECPYELDGQNLYSVKWYKNGREFFR